jgi:hypothetical protein
VPTAEIPAKLQFFSNTSPFNIEKPAFMQVFLLLSAQFQGYRRKSLQMCRLFIKREDFMPKRCIFAVLNLS